MQLTTARIWLCRDIEAWAAKNGREIAQAPQEGTCSLCGSRPGTTIEHSPASWIFRRITVDLKNPVPGYRIKRESEPLGSLQDNPAIPYPCCAECNSWMNEHIEKPVASVLEQVVIASRGLTELTADDQARLAAWYYKVAMFAVQDTGAIPFRQYEKDEFLRTAAPQPTDTFWLGQMVEPRFRKETSLHPVPQSFGRIPCPWSRTMPSALHRAYCLMLFQDIHRPVVLPPGAADSLIQIWPPVVPAQRWPPPVQIDLSRQLALSRLIDPMPMFNLTLEGTVQRISPPDAIYEPPPVLSKGK